MTHIFIKAEDRSKIQQIYTQLLEIPNLLVAIKLVGDFDFRAIIPIADFQDVFWLKDQVRRIHGLEEIEIFLEPIFWVWPINTFAVLIEPTILSCIIDFLLKKEGNS